MATFASDSFTGTTGTALQTYSASWAKHPSYADDMIINVNAATQSANGGSTRGYYHTGTPGNANYEVSADFIGGDETVGITDHRIGIAARMDTSANTMYLARMVCDPGTATERWELYRVNAGAFTSLGTYNNAFTENSTYPLKLRVYGSQISVFKDNEATAIIDQSDATPITAVGKAGIRGYTNVTGDVDDDRVQIDNFLAVDFGRTLILRRASSRQQHLLVR